MHVPLRENIETFCRVMDNCISIANSGVEQWKGVIPELEHWSRGRVEAFEFVKECLQKYLMQDEEESL